MIERREYQRFDNTFAVLISTPNVEKKIKTIDISLGGCGIYYAQKYYAIGYTISLEILLSRDETLKCDAEVVWIKPNNRSSAAYKVGLKFLNISSYDQQKLRRNIEPFSQG